MDPRELPKFADDIDLDPDFAKKLDEALGLCITSIGFGPGLYYDEDDQQRLLVWLEDPIEPLAPLSEGGGGGGGGCEDVFSFITLSNDGGVSGSCLPGIANYQTGAQDPPIAVNDGGGEGGGVPVMSAVTCGDFLDFKAGPGVRIDMIHVYDPLNHTGSSIREIKFSLADGVNVGDILYWDGNNWCRVSPPTAEGDHYLRAQVDAQGAVTGINWDDSTNCPDPSP